MSEYIFVTNIFEYWNIQIYSSHSDLYFQAPFMNNVHWTLLIEEIAVFYCINSCSNSFKDKTEDGWVVTRAKTKVCFCDDDHDGDGHNDNDNDDDYSDDPKTNHVNFMIY